MSLKLEKIYVNNYKSFHHTTFKLDDFNIIVGTNNAGKSNFMDLLEFIESALQNGLVDAVEKKGGFDRIKNFRSNDDSIEIKLNIKHSFSFFGTKKNFPEPQDAFQYLFDIDDMFTANFRVSGGKHYLSDLKVDANARVREVKKEKEGHAIYLSLSENKKKRDLLMQTGMDIKFKISLREEIEEKEENPPIETENKRLRKITKEDSLNINIENLEKIPRGNLAAALTYYFGNIESFEKDFFTEKISYVELIESLEAKTRSRDFVRDFLDSNILTYNFEVTSIRKSIREPEFPTLKKNGSNLHYILKELLSSPKYGDYSKQAYENITSALIGLVDEVEKIKIETQKIGTDSIPEILFMERKGFPVAREDISDGTLSMLAILTALYASFFAYLIAFEEPERHIHLGAISFLMDLFREYTQDKEKQVTITTQSSEILRNINPGIDNMIFVYRDEDGYSKSISSKDIEELKTLIEKYDYNIDEIVRNEILGYLGDYEEE